jgi:hypothetical protein
MRREDLLDPTAMAVRIVRFHVLLQELHDLYGEACGAGSFTPSAGLNGGRGSGFADTDPTASAVLSPTQRQLRSRARRAATLAGESMQQLERAVNELSDGFLLTDDQVLERFLEKRRAALAGPTPAR